MIEQFYDLRPEVLALDRKALDLCRAQFAHVEEIRDYNQLKMLRAFTDCGVEARHFWGSSGYGVWDDSRNKLEEVFARCMGAEAALVRPQFMSGTHTLTVALFGLLRTGDTLLAATGRPYDTLEGVIGIGDAGKGCGTLREFGVNYDECPLLPDFTPDYDLIAEKAKTATVVHIQRSRGYTQRNAFDLATIQKVADTARRANPNAVIFVDNCYGEFTQTAEPVAFGADIMAGSFIKNPGGGITPTGGYIAGRRDLVEKCSHRFTAPGIGGDLGCTQDSLRDTFLGFYYAPGVVCEALKTAIYAQCLLELAGVNPVPRYTADHNDIVTCFDSGSAAALPGGQLRQPRTCRRAGLHRQGRHGQRQLYRGQYDRNQLRRPAARPLHLLPAGRRQLYRRPCRRPERRAERVFHRVKRLPPRGKLSAAPPAD